MISIREEFLREWPELPVKQISSDYLQPKKKSWVRLLSDQVVFEYDRNSDLVGISSSHLCVNKKFYLPNTWEMGIYVLY